eukprot:1327153-Pyramimonas_sp.AAC.1
MNILSPSAIGARYEYILSLSAIGARYEYILSPLQGSYTSDYQSVGLSLITDHTFSFASSYVVCLFVRIATSARSDPTYWIDNPTY